MSDLNRAIPVDIDVVLVAVLMWFAYPTLVVPMSLFLNLSAHLVAAIGLRPDLLDDGDDTALPSSMPRMPWAQLGYEWSVMWGAMRRSARRVLPVRWWLPRGDWKDGT